MALAGDFPKAEIAQVVLTANPSTALTTASLDVGEATFSFDETASPPFVVAHGTSAREAAANLVAAINSVGPGDDVYFNAEHVDIGTATTSPQTIVLKSTIVGFAGGDFADALTLAEEGTALVITRLQEYDDDVPQFRDWIADILSSNQVNAEVIAELVRPLGGALGDPKVDSE